MSEKKNSFDLEDRLVNFACMCLEIADLLPASKAGTTLELQLVKSGTTAVLNYGDAQAAESAADFIDKMKLVLKEIRESRVNLKIIRKMTLVKDQKSETAFNESGELMAIFLKSIGTARKNNKKQVS